MNLTENRIIEIDRTDSTNLYAEHLLKSGKVNEGIVIRARTQTSGKGQGENKWISQPGKNITISMILYPCFLPVESQFMLNKSVCLAVLDFAQTLLPKGSCKIKWPNDIYIGTSKLGGILINNTISGCSFDTSIIGIGININQTQFHPSIPNPISVHALINNETDIDMALTILIEKLDLRYDQLKNGNLEQLSNEYDKNLLGYEQKRKFDSQETIFDGKIIGVDPYGRLIIETTDNRRLTFSHKEVELLLSPF
jgi:BirA family transcriptional regulator, biotin operon repressor / biotin---[acetyl-CoA-carboxylase] ligase